MPDEQGKVLEDEEKQTGFDSLILIVVLGMIAIFIAVLSFSNIGDIGTLDHH